MSFFASFPTKILTSGVSPCTQSVKRRCGFSESTPSLMTIVRTSPSRCDSFQGERSESESMRAAVSAALAIHSGVCGQKQDSGTGKCEP